MKLLLIALLFASSVAQAKVDSNYTLTPSEGQHELSPVLMVGVLKTEYKSNYGDNQILGALATVNYYYGLIEYLSVGLSVGYATFTSDYNRPGYSTQTSKTKGLSDSTIGVKGNLDLNNFGIYYSAAYAIPMEKSKYNNDTTDSNTATAAGSYNLTTGFAAPVSDYTAGAILSYIKFFEGKQTQTTNGVETEVTKKESTAHILKVYMEFQKLYHLTGALVHQRYSYLNQGFEFSARFETSPQSEIIPQVTALVAKHPEDYNAERMNDVYMGATFRYLF